ncbi:MAG TPA: PIN domain-containing protein [Gemmataceae bacterium]|nr:PIN domain-containing protein [Gemmataceae bacterium]
MATTVVEPVFVDANILVYLKVTGSPFHAAARTKLQGLAGAGHPLWLSRQVVREYLAGMSRPGTVTPPLPMSTLLADVQTLLARFLVAEDGPAVTAHLVSLLGSVTCAGKQVHDANIVATMLAHGIPRLLTHNVADFNRFAGHITVIPLIP